MEPSCVRQSIIPGTSRLFSDYLYHFENVEGFFGAHFSDADAFKRATAQLNFPESRRASLVSALREQGNDPAALAKLAHRGTVAVVTGQQVGLFSGPVYTVFKALTAVKLAHYLTESGTPAVPVFWLATEDHDLAEVDHAWLFDHHATPRKISVANAVTNGGPVGQVRLPEIAIADLHEALAGLPFADSVIERLRHAYRPGTSFGNAFKQFLQDLLGGSGLLFIDPLAAPVREIAAGFLSQVPERVPELVSALRERDASLHSAGYHTQVFVDQSASLLFLLTDEKRLPLRWKDGIFANRERSYTPTELSKAGMHLSPNALLRPVMQDYLLPTVSYIGGPAEIAYMAQSQVLYEKLLGRMPVIFPRNSFTLLDAQADKLLCRYGLRIPDLLDYDEQVKGRMAAKLVPAKLENDFSALRSATAASLDNLQRQLCDFDVTLASAARKSTMKILYQIDKLARKTAREAMRRDQRATRDAEYLVNLIYPHQHLQERFYSIVPFLAKHGLDVPERLLEQTQLVCPDHMVRTL